jgi:NNP family nitrate/nitrite transporter-like MFS transporter
MTVNDANMPECPIPEPFKKSVGAVLVLSGLFYITFVARIIFAPLMPFIQEDLAVSNSQAGSLFLMISIGLFTAPLLIGWLSAAIRYRGALAVANLGVGLMLLVTSYSKSLPAMQLSMALLGMTAGFHIPSAVASITAQVQKPDWGKALGIHQVAPPLSFVTAPLIATALAAILPWRGVLMVWGVFSVCCGLAFWIRGKSGDFKGQALNFHVAREVLSLRSFWIIIILLGMAMSGTAGIYAMLPLYLIRDHGFSPQLANTLIGLSQISGLIMVFFAGMIADRIGPNKTISLALFGAGVLTILIGVLSGLGLVAAIVLQPLCLTSFFPAAFAALSRSVRPRLRGVSNALGPAFGFLIGGGLTPTVIGYLAEARSFTTGIILVGCYILAGPIVVRFLKLGQFDHEDGC